MRTSVFGFALVTAMALCAMPQLARSDANAPAEPDGYRMDQYRSPVPETLAGGRVVSTAEARRIWEQKKALFVDVLPRPPKPETLPEGTVWRDKPRDNIPGSIWLPNVGFGKIHQKVEGYFQRNLEKHTGGDKTQALLFYCLDNCWMSWNAAKRAMTYGYTDVIWYPEGTDGWAFEDLPLERRDPER